MSRPWRALAAITVTTGLLTTMQLPALAASAVTPTVTVTIAAKSAYPKVTGDVLVFFKSGKFSKATISGRISGSVVAGDVAALLVQPFPFKHPPARTGSPIHLTGAPQSYSFAVTPAVATRYEVEVLTAGSPGTQVGKSSVRTVYVTSGGRTKGVKKCGRPVCTEKLRLYTVLPAAARKREGAKHIYFYFGLNLNHRVTPPPPPKHLKLDTHVTISKARRISATEFLRTITWSFTIGNDGYYFLPAFCTKDTESKDGLGLPGHHRCGVKRISSRVIYLG